MFTLQILEYTERLACVKAQAWPGEHLKDPLAGAKWDVVVQRVYR